MNKQSVRSDRFKAPWPIFWLGGWLAWSGTISAAAQPAPAFELPQLLPEAPPDPTVETQQLAQADAAFQVKRYEAALQGYEQLLVRSPGLVPLLYRKGVTLALLGRLPEATATWEEILTKVPGHPEATAALERARIKLGLDAAATPPAPGKPDEQEALIRRLLEEGRQGSARLLLETKRPGPADLRTSLLEGELLLREGKPALALAAFQGAVAAGPTGSRALLGMGEALLALRRPDQAAPYLELALLLAQGTTQLTPAEQERARQLLEAALPEQP